MPGYIYDNSLNSLSPDFKRLLEIQLITFIDHLDEAAVRSRTSSRKAMNAIPAPTASLYRLRKPGTNLPAA